MKKFNVPGEKAAAQARSERLKAFLTAFKGAPINTTDYTPEHYNPYKNVRRLWPNSEVWKPYDGKYPPRKQPGPGPSMDSPQPYLDHQRTRQGYGPE